MKNLMIITILICSGLPVSSAHSSGIDIFDIVGEKYGINSTLLRAIAWVESKNNPYAININGKSYFPKTRREAVELLDRITVHNFDVGIMQISNRYWLRRFNIDPEYLFDKDYCVEFGAYILFLEIQKHGYKWEAVGYYHSSKQPNQRKYIQKVLSAYLKIKEGET